MTLYHRPCCLNARLLLKTYDLVSRRPLPTLSFISVPRLKKIMYPFISKPLENVAEFRNLPSQTSLKLLKHPNLSGEDSNKNPIALSPAWFSFKILGLNRKTIAPWVGVVALAACRALSGGAGQCRTVSGTVGRCRALSGVLRSLEEMSVI